MKKILGIDPGTRNLGYGIINLDVNKKVSLAEAGVIKFDKFLHKDLAYQISQMCEAIDLIFSSSKIDEVVIESMFYAYNPQSVLKLAQFRGALLLKIIQIHGNFIEYSPLQIKKSITGIAKASKEQVNFMVKQILGIKKEIKPLDISDAIAIALTHINHIKKG